MSWQSADPIDWIIGKMLRSRIGKTLKVAFVCFLGVYALAIGTTSLKRAPFLKPLRMPLSFVNTATRTTQSWGMFYKAPDMAEFNMIVHTGAATIHGNVLSKEQLGPILPGFGTFVPSESLRYHLCFSQMMTRDIYVAQRTRYFRRLSAALLRRNAELESPPTHFVAELKAEMIISPQEVRETRMVSRPSSDRTPPYVIGWK